MLKLTSTLVLTVLLAACASSQMKAYGEWVNEGKARAERGELKWSDYYRGCFAKLVESPERVNGKSFELEYLHKMIGYAQEYESGSIKFTEFEEKRRLAQIVRAKGMEAGKSTQQGACCGVSEPVNLQTVY